MKLPTSVFDVVDWDSEPRVEYPGETGTSYWRTRMLGDIRIRMVEYSPEYVADHWCDRGHILLVVEGEITAELQDGRAYKLKPGMSFQVSDFGDAAHRPTSVGGAKIFIVD